MGRGTDKTGSRELGVKTFGRSGSDAVSESEPGRLARDNGLEDALSVSESPVEPLRSARVLSGDGFRLQAEWRRKRPVQPELLRPSEWMGSQEGEVEQCR